MNEKYVLLSLKLSLEVGKRMIFHPVMPYSSNPPTLIIVDRPRRNTNVCKRSRNGGTLGCQLGLFGRWWWRRRLLQGVATTPVTRQRGEETCVHGFTAGSHGIPRWPRDGRVLLYATVTPS